MSSKVIKSLKEKISEEIVWDNEKINLWRKVAKEKQQFYCNVLGDRTWEKYEVDEEHFLKLKIGFSLFGPQTSKDDDVLNMYFNDPEKIKIIDKLFAIIKKECKSDTLCVAFIFVIAWIDEKYAEFPIIRILKKTNKLMCSYFLDALGRLYKSWPKFLKNNVFPKCIYCYPKHGFYSWDAELEQVILEYGRSPRSKITKGLLRSLDSVLAVAGFGAAAVSFTSLATPVAAPILIGATATAVASGIWTTGRTVNTIIDRKVHSQSISFVDQEGRACWLSIAFGILGAASAGAIQYTQFIARNGRVLSRVAALVINSLEVGNISVLGLGIINNIVTMIENKNMDVKNLSELIVFVLFFCHYTMSFKTAKEIVIEVQNSVISSVGLEGNEQLVFTKILEETRNIGKMEGNANVIMSLKNIENKEKFFSNLLQIHEKVKDSNSVLCFGDNGLIRLNDKIDIDLNVITRFSGKSQNILMPTSKTSKQSPAHLNNFIEVLKSISEMEVTSFANLQSELCRHLNIKNLNEFEISGKKILSSAKPADIYILNQTVNIIENQSKNSVFQSILSEVKKIGEKVTCNDILEFYTLLQKVVKTYEKCEHVYTELKKLYTVIQTSFKEEHPDFTVPLCEEDEDQMELIDLSDDDWELISLSEYPYPLKQL